MAKKESEKLNAALAASIKAQPVSAVQAAIAELRGAGLYADADELEAVLAEREQDLAAARAAKEAEEEAARQKAIAAAQKEFDEKAAAYVALRDEALDALAEYIAKAQPGMVAYGEVQHVGNALDVLTGDMAERPHTALDVVQNDERFQAIRNVVWNSRPL